MCVCVVCLGRPNGGSGAQGGAGAGSGSKGGSALVCVFSDGAQAGV
jgi:hypothetical protein